MTDKFGQGSRYRITPVKHSSGNSITYYHGWDLRRNKDFGGYVFIQYPRNRSYPNPPWDTHLEPGHFCKNHEYIKTGSGLKFFRCKGHVLHEDVAQSAGNTGNGPLLTRKGDTFYHGYKPWGHKFFRYSPGQNLPNLQWDTYNEHKFCTNHRHVGGNQFICLGHKFNANKNGDYKYTGHNTFLGGCTVAKGCAQYPTLQQAQVECDKLGAGCGGVTKRGHIFAFELRKGTTPHHAPYKERSWLKSCHNTKQLNEHINYLNSNRDNFNKETANILTRQENAKSQNSAARTQLQSEHDKKMSEMTAQYQTEVKAITEQQNKLDEEKAALQTEYYELEKEYKLKRMEVTQLNSDIRVAKYEAAAAQLPLKTELAKLQAEYLTNKDNLDKKKDEIEEKQLEIDKKKAEIKELEIKIGNRWEDYNRRTEDLEKLIDEIDELENSKSSRLTNLKFSQSVENRLRDNLAVLEKELAELKKDPEKKYNPLILKRLLRRKKKILEQLFRVEEDAYNTHSEIVNVRNEREHTTKMLLDNQYREITENTKNIDSAKNEL